MSRKNTVRPEVIEEGLEPRFVPVLGYSIMAKDAADAEQKALKILADKPTSPLTDGK